MYKVVVWTQCRVYELLPDGQLGNPVEPVDVPWGFSPFEIPKIFTDLNDAKEKKTECLKVIKEVLDEKEG